MSNILPNPPYIDDNIWLDEETHTYFLKDDPKQTFTSATTLIHQFFEHFNAPVIAEGLVTKGKRYFGLDIQAIIALWEAEGYQDESIESRIKKGTPPYIIAKHLLKFAAKYGAKTVKGLIEEWRMTGVSGTSTHLELENYILKQRKSPVETLKGIGGKLWIDRVWDRDEYDWYPEVIMYDREIGISGTIDLLLVNRKTGEIHLFDWKTNKKIYKRAFGGKKGIHPITAYIDDCNYMHYTIQLSIYQYLLEKNFGVKVKSRQILWLPGEEQVVTYNCKYKPEIVENMFDALKSQRKIDQEDGKAPLKNIEEVITKELNKEAA
jgi:hypothetical protein